MRLILIWIFNALALLAVAYLLPDIRVDSFISALIAALVLGLINTLLRPLLILLTLPVTVLTLGLFILVINGSTANAGRCKQTRRHTQAAGSTQTRILLGYLRRGRFNA